MRYVQDIQPNVPSRTTYIVIYVGADSGYYFDVFMSGFLTRLCLYMNVPTYLVAQNIHGPCFTAPHFCACLISKLLSNNSRVKTLKLTCFVCAYSQYFKINVIK